MLGWLRIREGRAKRSQTPLETLGRLALLKWQEKPQKTWSWGVSDLDGEQNVGDHFTWSSFWSRDYLGQGAEQHRGSEAYGSGTVDISCCLPFFIYTWSWEIPEDTRSRSLTTKTPWCNTCVVIIHDGMGFYSAAAIWSYLWSWEKPLTCVLQANSICSLVCLVGLQ